MATCQRSRPAGRARCELGRAGGLIKTGLLVPLRDNEGQPFSSERWRELHARLLQFGGLSRLNGVQREWVSAGKVYRDRSRQYTVSLVSWRQLPAWLDVAEWALVAFRQEALYIEIAGVPDIIDARH
jgi:hypothetical protein